MALRRSHKTVLLVAVTFVLLAAAGIFLHTEEDEVVLAIPVEFENIPHNVMPLLDNAPVLEVRLRGPAKVLQSAKDSQLRCRVDLSMSKPGPLPIEILPEMIEVPRRISILDIHPTSLTVNMDERVEKTVPIVPHLNEDPGVGYVIARTEATPSTVTLTGPVSILEGISAVRTTPIDVSGLTETTRKTVALKLNHQTHLQPRGESLVEVEIVVEPKMIEKWMNLPVEATGGDRAYVINPDRIEILLRGPMAAVRNLSETDAVQAYVDLSGLEPGTYVRPVVIKPPLDITLVEAKPEAFTVKVLKKKRPGKGSQ